VTLYVYENATNQPVMLTEMGDSLPNVQ